MFHRNEKAQLIRMHVTLLANDCALLVSVSGSPVVSALGGVVAAGIGCCGAPLCAHVFSMVELFSA